MSEPDARSAYEKKVDLYLRQKELLDTFLAHHAITPAQYEKSLGDLTRKMEMDELNLSQGRKENRT